MLKKHGWKKEEDEVNGRERNVEIKGGEAKEDGWEIYCSSSPLDVERKERKIEEN